MSKRREIEVLTTQLEELPVVRAWAGLGYAAPGRVEILVRKSKSVTYRLVGVGRDGSDVIAKRCRRHTAVIEQRIYAQVLPHLPMQTLGYYGAADDESGADADGHEICWLFLEYARGEEFEPKNPEHRALAARWLATLHTSSAGLTTATELPHRGPSHYLEHLHAARRTIRRNYGNPGLSLGDRVILDQVLARLDFLEGRWEDVEAACREMPWSLVHGDFAERNVRVCRNDTGLTLFAFDWEVSGWGPSPVDLTHADLGLYWSLVRDAGSTLDFDTLRRQASLCQLLRDGIAATNWTVDGLRTIWLEKPLGNLVIYYARMTESLRTLGWIP